MKTVSMEMKMEKDKGKSDGCCCGGPCGCEPERPRYPWGLQIHLDKEQLEALGVKGLPQVGSSITLQAVAKVTGCNESEQEGGEKNRSVSLQITDLGIEGPKEKVDATAIFPETSKGAK